MSTSRHAQSKEIQIRKVFRYMHQHGSINRYEADKIGVCHLAARVQDLELRGMVYNYIDEDRIKDFHGIAHNGIRRYRIDWGSMELEAVKYFRGWVNE